VGWADKPESGRLIGDCHPEYGHADPKKAHATDPVRINLAAQPWQDEGITLQTCCQDSDRDQK